ncbi:BTAD domain-containing putative transcriptional regulator [Streptomyces sp. CC224B]|uniref:BTAD domain-containing putative transcriptional regulator n=1 Tax=Streptomyces sp. CC224B TaxID=3044571 RepID=UPI0024A7F8AB|nr:BTAD domain-containing putative transcriptional regulator [Streptomyces sp. CC224B]
MTFHVLGPLVARDAHGCDLGLRGPRHRAVLARLLVARRRAVPVSWLVDDLWDEPPPTAVGTIRTFVADLRKALEPGRARRAPARLLVTAGPGYALTAAPDAVDAWRFETAVREAGRLLDGGPPAPEAALAALTGLDGALGLWRGPAYAEWADADWARAEVARLDGLRLLAVERRARLALALGRAADAVLDLESHAGAHPWREEAWELLALALYRSGRQGDALAVLRRARDTLAGELGVDPGEGLRRLEGEILAQSVREDAGAGAGGGVRPAGARTDAGSSEKAGSDAKAGSGAVAGSGVMPGSGVVAGVDGGPRGRPVAAGGRPATCLVGRDTEVAVLESAAREAVRDGRFVLALLSGEAGAGKTALARELTGRLGAEGWATAWGRAPEGAAASADGEASAGGAVGRLWEEVFAGLEEPGATTVPGATSAAPASATAPAAGSSTAAAAGSSMAADLGSPSSVPVPVLVPVRRVPASSPSPSPAPAAPSSPAAPASPSAPSPAPAHAVPQSPATDAHHPDPWHSGAEWSERGWGAAGGGGRAAARRVAARLSALVPPGHPLLLVLDDLHGADEESLDVLATLATAGPARPVLLVGTYRDTEVPPQLAEFLARAARAEPVRVPVRGLAEGAVAELLTAVAGRGADPATARAVSRRSGGNPFFVRELARLYAAGGTAALSRVPAGVRDLVRARLGALAQETRTVLRLAAVVGEEADLDVLGAVTGDEETVLDAVDAATAAGFLVEPEEGELAAERVRFAHALVHETVYEDLSRPRRARLHTAVAEALELLRPDAVEAVAHHYVRAATRATAARALAYATRAARRAEASGAPHRAGRWWRAALTAYDRQASGAAREGPLSATGAVAVPDPGRGPGARGRLPLLMGLVRSLAVTGGLAEARRHRGDALAVARAGGDPEFVARVLGAFDVPGIWARNDDEDLSRRVVAAARWALAALPDDGTYARRATRCRLLTGIAMETRGDTTGSGLAAAREAEALARGLAGRGGSGRRDETGRHDEARRHDGTGRHDEARRHDGTGRHDEPGEEGERGRAGERAALLAFALNGRYLHTFHRPGLAPERARIGAELVELSARHGLVTFEVLGHLMLLQSHSALADLTRADAHATAADRLAERYGLPLVGVFTSWYAALRAAVAGRTDEAAAAYRAAAARLPGSGMTGMEQEDLLPLALMCLGLGAEPAAGGVPGAGQLLDLRLCLRARAAVRAGDTARMEASYRELLPGRDEVAGAGSGLLALGPVAQDLGDLAAALGRPVDAAAHYRHALAVSDRAGAPHWASAAGAALTAVRGCGDDHRDGP